MEQLEKMMERMMGKTKQYKETIAELRQELASNKSET